MEDAIKELTPIIVQIIGGVLGLVLLWIGIQRQKLEAMNIDATRRESIKSSMITGAQAALFDGLTGHEAVAATVAYAKAAKPAEIKAAAMTPAVLESNAKAKVVEVAVATVAAENSNTPGSAATVAAKLP